MATAGGAGIGGMVAIRQEGGEAGAEGTVKARRERGRAARQKVPCGAHEAIGNVDRDPVELLEISSHGRVERLVPLRYGRVIQSPFAFYRGSAIIQAHDLAGTADSGLHMQICGDCHLANFGGFATPERALLFDLNDFDQISPGPWEWDLKRLCASFVVAARHLQHKAGVAEAVVREAVGSYQRRMLAYAEMGMLGIWYDRITFERLLEEETLPEVQKRIRRGMERAADRTHESLLPKLAERIGDRWSILDTPPAIFRVRGEQTLFGTGDDWLAASDADLALDQAYKDYLSTLAPDRRQLLGHFTRHDVAFKMVGVGSVGTRCLVQLMWTSMRSRCSCRSRRPPGQWWRVTSRARRARTRAAAWARASA
ncbi:hypothetical protein D8I24_0646 [Cupriavidus necator H850]|jgi:hypothetical protein|nr:hypothetical protein D8I24_0646 [Cupriavidus necator H850]